jgi:hypothetical protein
MWPTSRESDSKAEAYYASNPQSRHRTRHLDKMTNQAETFRQI